MFATALPAAADGRFFPTRSADEKISSTAGVLTDFGIGNALGTITVREADGTYEYYIGERTLLEGKAIDCSRAPTANFTPKKDECTYWPHDVVLGTTRVEVRYWMQKRPDTNENVRVVQTIDPIASVSDARTGGRDAALANVKSLANAARSGDRSAFAKLVDMLAHSDGAIAEAVSDGIARASTAQPALALVTLAALPSSERNGVFADPDTLCSSGEAHAFAIARAPTTQTRALQKKLVAFCSSPASKSQRP